MLNHLLGESSRWPKSARASLPHRSTGEPSSGKALWLVSQRLEEMMLLDAADPRDLLGLCWTDFPGGDLWWGLPWFYSFALPRWAETRVLWDYEKICSKRVSKLHCLGIDSKEGGCSKPQLPRWGNLCPKMGNSVAFYCGWRQYGGPISGY
jgi:hypothetical protein